MCQIEVKSKLQITSSQRCFVGVKSHKSPSLRVETSPWWLVLLVLRHY